MRDRDGNLILFSSRFHPDCGPEHPFDLPSEQGQTAPDGIGQNNETRQQVKSDESETEKRTPQLP